MLLEEEKPEHKSSVIVPEGTKKIKDFAKISKRKAKNIATQSYQGRVKKADLISSEGYLAWKIEVKGNEGQKEIFIDPANGNFLGYGLTK